MKKAIYDILRKANRQMKAKEIADELGLLPPFVNAYLRDLEKENFAESELIDDRDNEGFYWLWRAR